MQEHIIIPWESAISSLERQISRKKERPLSVYRMAGRVRERMDAVYRYIHFLKMNMVY